MLAWVWTDAGGWLLECCRESLRSSADYCWSRPVIERARCLTIGEVGVPTAVTPANTAALDVAFFSGVDPLRVVLAAAALGRLSIRSQRDIGSEAGEVTEVLPRNRPKRRRTVLPRRRTPVVQ